MANITDQFGDILLYIKWGNISKDYFGFSRSWIYQRLNGYDGNALRDIAAKLNRTADNI